MSTQLDIPGLYNAAKAGCCESVTQMLLDPQTHFILDQAFQCAVENNHPEVVNLFLQDGRVNPMRVRNKAIRTASQKGFEKTVELLMADTRVDPNSHRNDALRQAARFGHINIVRMLMKHVHSNPGDFHNYAIRNAVRYNHAEIVKLLLTHDSVDPFVTSYWPQLSAFNMYVKANNYDMVNLLLDHPRITVEAVNTAVKYAASGGFHDLIKLFVDRYNITRDAATESVVAATNKGLVDVVKYMLANMHCAVTTSMIVKLVKEWNTRLPSVLRTLNLNFNRPASTNTLAPHLPAALQTLNLPPPPTNTLAPHLPAALQTLNLPPLPAHLPAALQTLNLPPPTAAPPNFAPGWLTSMVPQPTLDSLSRRVSPEHLLALNMLLCTEHVAITTDLLNTVPHDALSSTTLNHMIKKMHTTDTSTLNTLNNNARQILQLINDQKKKVVATLNTVLELEHIHDDVVKHHMCIALCGLPLYMLKV